MRKQHRHRPDQPTKHDKTLRRSRLGIFSHPGIGVAPGGLEIRDRKRTIQPTMPQKKPSRPGKRPGRPSIPPPPLLFPPGERLEGSGILEEIDGGLGVVLWQAYRSVALWSSAPPEKRAGLFAPSAHPKWMEALDQVGPPAPLRAPLRRIGALLATPDAIAVDGVARVCQRIARWADRCGLAATALVFVQAAALLHPDRARPALVVGVLAERSGQEARAETWLRRALVLARREADHRSRAYASLHLARILTRRGEAAQANRLYRRVLALSRRAGLRSLRDEANRALSGAPLRPSARHPEESRDPSPPAWRATG